MYPCRACQECRSSPQNPRPKVFVWAIRRLVYTAKVLSRGTVFSTPLHVRPAKTQISQRVRCLIWVFTVRLKTVDPWLHYRVPYEDSDQTKRMCRLSWVFGGRTSNNKEMLCPGSLGIMWTFSSADSNLMSLHTTSDRNHQQYFLYKYICYGSSCYLFRTFVFRIWFYRSSILTI